MSRKPYRPFNQLQASPPDGGGGAPSSGGVGTVSITAGGTYLPDGSYTATQSSTSGSGTGAEFTVTIAGSSVTSVDSISAAGSGYQVGDTIGLSIPSPGFGAGGVVTVGSVV